MDYYISGDVAPGGRFKFSYISTNKNTMGETAETDTTVTETDPEDVTDSDTSPVTDAPGTDTENETEASRQSCGSVINMSFVIMMASLAAAFIKH